jgi:parvulin-like peptidyl-prolyl isomerase
MAKRERKQRPAKMTRKYQSRVAQEKRQLRYIYAGVVVFLAIVGVVLLAGVAKTQVIDPSATRSAKNRLKGIPAVTVDGTMISIADWQARVRYERQLRINQAVRIEQQLALFDASTEFGQQIIQQGQAQVQQIVNELELGDGIASDVLQQMVDEQLIRQEAARRGIVITPEELQKHIEINLFAFPYPPTPEPAPTLPPPTLAPTVTATPEPTVTPSPTPRSLQDFQTDYQAYTEQIRDITEMSEQAWRAMIEGELYQQKLFDAFKSEVVTNVQQIQGRYISAIDQDTAQVLFERLEAGESFDTLEAEIQADESESPKATVGSFDWQPIGVLQQSFGEEFAKIVFNTDAGRYTSEILSASNGRFYIVYVEGSEVRELADYLVEQQQSDLFQTWLSQEEASDKVVYGDWRPYIPREPSLQ